MEIRTENSDREGNRPYPEIPKKTTKGWNIEPEKGKDAGPNESYDPANDAYIFKKSRRYRIKIQVSGTTPEMSAEYLERIKKTFLEEYSPYNVPERMYPIAIRFHLHLVFPGSERYARYANAGYYYPSGIDLRAWSDFIYNGMEGVLYESRSQIVCSGEEVMYSKIPGLVIEQFVLWDLVDTMAYRKRSR